MTEHSATDNINHLPYWSDQLRFAEELNECMLAGGTAYIHWYMRAHWSFVGTGEEQYNPGNTKNQLLPRAYVMSHFSKNVTGSTRLGTNASIYTGTESEYEFSAYIKGDSLIVMAINTTGSEYNLNLKLPYKAKSGKRILSTSNESLCQQTAISIAEPTKELTVSLPAQSLTTLIFTIDNNNFMDMQVGDDIVSDAPTVWEGQTAEYGGLGHTAYERYLHGGSIGAGDVLTQTLRGVKNGTYNVTLELAASFTSGRGFECPTGTGYSLAFANDEFRTLEVVDRGWVSSIEPITITCTVTNGILRYGIYNIADAGNWYVANVTSIEFVSENTNGTFDINTSAQHGILTASTYNAVPGTTVTLAATPDANYQLKSITGTYEGYASETISASGTTVNGTNYRVSTIARDSYGWILKNSSPITITAIGSGAQISKVELNISDQGPWASQEATLSATSGTVSVSGGVIRISSLHGQAATPLLPRSITALLPPLPPVRQPSPSPPRTETRPPPAR